MFTSGAIARTVARYLASLLWVLTIAGVSFAFSIPSIQKVETEENAPNPGSPSGPDNTRPAESASTGLDETTRSLLGQLTYPEAKLPADVVERAAVLFGGKLTDAYPEYGNALAAAKDEFEKREVDQRLSPEFVKRAEAERRALMSKVWLVRAPVKIEEYDFQRGCFPVKAVGSGSYSWGAWSIGPGLVKIGPSGPLRLDGVIDIVRNSPFEPGSGNTEAASYLLKLDEATAKQLRTWLTVSEPTEIELAVRLEGFGNPAGFTTKEVWAAVVAHRIVGKNGGLTRWRGDATGRAQLDESVALARPPESAANLAARTISNSARQTMSHALSSETGSTKKLWIRVDPRDREASGFASEIAGVFKDADWEVRVLDNEGLRFKPGLLLLIGDTAEPPSYIVNAQKTIEAVGQDVTTGRGYLDYYEAKKREAPDWEGTKFLPGQTFVLLVGRKPEPAKAGGQ